MGKEKGVFISMSRERAKWTTLSRSFFKKIQTRRSLGSSVTQ